MSGFTKLVPEIVMSSIWSMQHAVDAWNTRTAYLPDCRDVVRGKCNEKEQQ